MNRLARLALLLASLVGCVACVLPSAALAVPDATEQRPAQRASGRDRAQAHTELAEGYYQLQKYAFALEELSIALEAYPGYGPAFNLRGLVYLALEDFPRAEAEFKRSVQLDPKDPGVRNNFGVLLCRMGKVDAAVAEWMVAASNPFYASSERSYVNAAICLNAAARPGEALRLLDDFGKRKPLGKQASDIREKIYAKLTGGKGGGASPIATLGEDSKGVKNAGRLENGGVKSSPPPETQRESRQIGDATTESEIPPEIEGTATVLEDSSGVESGSAVVGEVPAGDLKVGPPGSDSQLPGTPEPSALDTLGHGEAEESAEPGAGSAATPAEVSISLDGAEQPDLVARRLAIEDAEVLAEVSMEAAREVKNAGQLEDGGIKSSPPPGITGDSGETVKAISESGIASEIEGNASVSEALSGVGSGSAVVGEVPAGAEEVGLGGSDRQVHGKSQTAESDTVGGNRSQEAAQQGVESAPTPTEVSTDAPAQDPSSGARFSQGGPALEPQSIAETRTLAGSANDGREALGEARSLTLEAAMALPDALVEPAVPDPLNLESLKSEELSSLGEARGGQPLSIQSPAPKAYSLPEELPGVGPSPVSAGEDGETNNSSVEPSEVGVAISPVVLYVGAPSAKLSDARLWAALPGFAGMHPSVMQSSKGGWRVRLGPFDNRADRDAAIQAAKEAGLPVSSAKAASQAGSKARGKAR